MQEKLSKSKFIRTKQEGAIYTPNYIVKNICDLAGYCDQQIRKKHVIDNSCGDGAFLVEIVERYCKECFNKKINTKVIVRELETYIHGIEIDKTEHAKCLENLSKVATKYDLKNVKWDIICADTLAIKNFDGKMDFVLGNPPYVRIHNIKNNTDIVKKSQFTKKGMTDLYILFFEIGLNMLNDKGILGYITPNSYFNSIAGKDLRKFIVANNYIDKIVDLKHFQAFNATTYTAITILNKNKLTKNISYFEYDKQKFIAKHINELYFDDFYISDNFYFASKNNLRLMKKILFNQGLSDIEVKNGYATLRDDVFIGKFNFKSSFLRPVIKASKGIKLQMFYPYDENSKLIPEDKIKTDKNIYKYIIKNKDILKKRDNENDKYWYAFGRSQGIKDTFKYKIAINTLLRTKEDLKISEAPSGTGVYSGLYIIGQSINKKQIKDILCSDEFITYISLLGKYKSGGYYTFSSKDIKIFLDYKLSYDGGLFNE